MGNLELTKFVVEIAYELGLLDQIVNAKDYVGVTPLFMLCERGYDKESAPGKKPEEHQ